MLTGANHRNCYHFIGYITGCSPSTIGRVYNMMMESSGNREPPEHGMKRVWQENYKQNKVVSQEGEKSMNGGKICKQNFIYCVVVPVNPLPDDKF